jgi:hypothetical protein
VCSAAAMHAIYCTIFTTVSRPMIAFSHTTGTVQPRFMRNEQAVSVFINRRSSFLTVTWLQVPVYDVGRVHVLHSQQDLVRDELDVRLGHVLPRANYLR